MTWPPGRGATGRNYGGEELPVRQTSEPLVGYRYWLIHTTIVGLILHSLHVDYVWELESEAACKIVGRVHERIPDPQCLCGLYAMLPEHPLSEWEHMTRGRVHASGSVALSGRIIRCDAGFKAEHATVQSPVVLDVEYSGFHSCTEDVVAIQFQENRPMFFGLCPTHAKLESELPEPAPMVDAGIWMREACRSLEARYRNIEFISWIGGET